MKTTLYILLPLLLFILCCSSASKKPSSGSWTGEQIIEALNQGKNIHIKGAEIKGDIDFTKLKDRKSSGIQTGYTHITSSILFDSCTFLGKIIAQSINNNVYEVCRFEKPVQFYKCHFKSEINLSNAIFFDDFLLSESIVEQHMQMKAARFGQTCSVYKTHFLGEFEMQECQMKGSFQAMGLEVGGTFNMQQSDFQGDAQFSEAEIWGYWDASLCFFRKGAFFNYMNCHKALDFTSASFYHRFEILQSTIEGALKLNNVWIQKALLWKSTSVNGPVSLEGAHAGLKQPDISELKKSTIK
jgi:hypothetical protein